MEWWWLIILVPLFNLWGALSEAWRRLLQVKTEAERKAIIERAGASAFFHSALTIGIAVAPWPYKLLGLAPWAFRLIAGVLGFSPRFRIRRWTESGF